MAGRFARTDRTETVALGPCQCPGTPHTEGDWAKCRVEFGGSTRERIRDAGLEHGPLNGQLWDSAAATSMLIKEGVVEWNLLDERTDDEGVTQVRPVPVTLAAAGALDAETRATLDVWLEAHLPESWTALPNGRSARSPATSRASASRTRKRSRSSTTPSSR